jgi:SagB-type dehydrogenase family enzyme
VSGERVIHPWKCVQRALQCLALLVIALGVTTVTRAEEFEMITLPAPQTTGGKPLMEALGERRSTREFSSRALPVQILSDLLWAAGGVNRPDSGKRTAPSARDWREIDIYVVTAEGTWRYDADAHALAPVMAGDLRAQTGHQDFVASAPLNLVYVADLNRMGDADAEHKRLYSATDTGFVAQNVYLYCASAELAVVVRGSIDRDALARALKLAPNQRVILAQTVGYPR